MKSFVTANDVVKYFRTYLGIPEIQKNNVHQLLARYRVKPLSNSQRGPVYKWDDVINALNSMHWDQENGTFYDNFSSQGEDDYSDVLKSINKKDNKDNFEQTETIPDESDMEYCSQQCLDSMNENRHNRRKVFLNESQLEYIKAINEGKFPVDPNKVLVVKKFLDGNFQKGGISSIGEDGYPKTISIVALKGTDGSLLKNMSDVQLFDMLQDKFFKLYADRDKRDKLLKQIIKDWYKDKISKHGMLTVNFI